MIDILVISHACVTGINRLPYRRLAEQGWDLELLVPSALAIGSGNQNADPRSINDPPLHSLYPTTSKPRSYMLKGLNDLLDERQPRLILLDGDPASFLSMQLGHWAKKNRSALVCQSCDNLSRQLLVSFQRAGLKGMTGALAIKTVSILARRNVSHVLVISDDGMQVFNDLGYKNKVSKIPLGFDPKIFMPDSSQRAQTREQLGLDRVTIAYFGRMTEEKGVHILLQALARLKCSGWQLLLDEFGRYADQYQEKLKTLIQDLGLIDNTVFFDATHEEMPAYMNAADIVVVPSITRPFWKEQYGRIAPEAMACGRAVVVSDSGTLPELAGDAAVVFPEGDIDQLAVVLNKLVASEQSRAKLGEKAYQRAHQYLSVDQQVDVMNRLFKELIGEPHAA